MHYNYREEQTRKAIDFIASEYGVEPEFLWVEKFPTYSVYRNSRTKKWFAIIMTVPGTKIGLNAADAVEIIDLKFDKGQALDFVEGSGSEFIRPGFHMNKRNWITIVLGDGKIPDDTVFALINKSYLLSDSR